MRGNFPSALAQMSRSSLLCVKLKVFTATADTADGIKKKGQTISTISATSMGI